ncbi:MAG: glycosyltransferase family 4 protein [Gemmatimonadales bacterium]
MSPLLTGLAVTAGTTACLLWLIERHATALGLMDVPNDRSSHSRPTPRGGGIAIVVGSLLGVGVFVVMKGAVIPPAGVAGLVAASVIALVSLVDDIRPLPPALRLVTHLAAATALLPWLPLPLAIDLPGIGPVPLGRAAPAFAVFWIVAVTNIYNFMDGIDGLAGGQGLVAGALWGAAGVVTGDAFLTGSGFAIAVSCAIFLVRNWAPAHIFLGDAGSAFLGFSFAVLPLLAAGGTLGVRAWPCGVFLLWLFLFDATLTLVRRLGRGENLFRAHRDHLYQRLVVAGATHVGVSRVYLGLAAVVGCTGLQWALGRLPGWGVLLPAGVTAAALVLVLRRRERAPSASVS